MNKKQIRAIESLKAAADNARKVGLTEHHIEIIMKPDAKIDDYLERRESVAAGVEEPTASPKVEESETST